MMLCVMEYIQRTTYVNLGLQDIHLVIFRSNGNARNPRDSYLVKFDNTVEPRG